METSLALSRWLALPCRWFAALAGALLLVLAAVIIYDVIGRRFYATGSFKLQELEWHLHGGIAVLAFGYAYLKDGHVRIDIFARRIGERRRLWMELGAICLFLLPFMVLLVWFGYDFALRSFLRGETSSGGVGLSHRWIIKSVVPLAALLTISGGLSVALRCVAALFRPDLCPDAFERD